MENFVDRFKEFWNDFKKEKIKIRMEYITTPRKIRLSAYHLYIKVSYKIQALSSRHITAKKLKMPQSLLGISKKPVRLLEMPSFKASRFKLQS